MDPLDEELAERGRLLIAAAVAETTAPLALRERIEADTRRAGKSGARPRSRGVMGWLLPAGGLVAAGGRPGPRSRGRRRRAQRAGHRCAGLRRPGAARAGRGQLQRRRAQEPRWGGALPLLGRLVPVGGGGRARRQDQGPQRATPCSTTIPRARAPPTRSSAATRSTRPPARASRPRTGPAVHHPGQRPADRDLDARRPHLRVERPARRARAEAAPAGELEGQGQRSFLSDAVPPRHAAAPAARPAPGGAAAARWAVPARAAARLGAPAAPRASAARDAGRAAAPRVGLSAA